MVRETPDRIGRYEVLRELGSGSMGRVYLARDPNIDRRVALKVLAPSSGVGAAEEAELRRRFVLEARAAGKVKHPGIVTVYDAETDAETGGSFIAMEWVDGESLEALLARTAPPATPAVAQSVRIVEQVALALDAAHRAGLVHRDVKPANVLIDRNGQARLSDFGIAKFSSMANTAAGRLVGSPFYMAPEQVRSETVDGRSDLFALGCVLYQAVTGKVPFAGDSLASITYKILEIDPAPARSANPRVSPELDAVITKALRKDPDERFQTGLELAGALQALDLAPSSTTPTGTLILTPDPPAERPAHPARAEPGPRRPWIPRHRLPRHWIPQHRGAALAVLTLLAVPFLLLVLGRQAEEPEPETAGREPAAPTESAPGDEPARTGAQAGTGAATAPATAPTTASTHPPATSSPADPRKPAAGSAWVEVQYRNHLRSSRMTIRVDDEVSWSGAVGSSKGWLGRTVGDSVRRRIEVPAGKHVIGIRIQGSEGTVDATKRIWGEFTSGGRRSLKVRLVPPRVLRLSWDD
jgi:serine/threonine-protein kinase